MIGWLFWDPDWVAFTLPFIDHPIAWYGILFAIGFFCSYQLLLFFMRRFFYFYPEVSETDLLDIERLLSSKPSFIEEDVLCDILEKKDKKIPQMTLAMNKWLHRKSQSPISSKLPSKKLSFIHKYLRQEEKERLLKRLYLEEEYKEAIRPLQGKARIFCDRLASYVLIGTVLGARLGHIFFYERFMDYLTHPLSIVKTWEGGLASHGAIVGLLGALFLFYWKNRKEYPFLSIRRLYDLIALPGLLLAVLIRFGNFVNQEILGVPTQLPWAVIFGHPVGGSAVVPRHPVQLYEAIFYGCLFFFFSSFFPKKFFRVGMVSGITLITVFCFRLLIECIKCKQSYWIMASYPITMGQLLSLPLIIWGIKWLITTKQESV